MRRAGRGRCETGDREYSYGAERPVDSGIEAEVEELHVVPSRDGVDIACWISGSGPYLVLVHGVSADHSRWATVLPRLREHFTVCAVDRRGRGGSGDSLEYSTEREFDDIAAVCDSLDGTVYLLGHSHGGMYALGAAARSRNIDRLILYEPSVKLNDSYFAPERVARMERMVQEGDRDGVLTTLFREVVQVSEEDLTALRADPSWEGRLKSAHTIPRELTADIPEAAHFRDVTIPTLLLTGEVSPPEEIAATNAVHEALPRSRVVVMPGQGHVAMTTGPGLFVDEILRFLMS